MASANNIIQVTVYPTPYGVSNGLPGPPGPTGPVGIGFKPLNFTEDVVIQYGSESYVIVDVLSTQNALTVGNTVKVSFPTLSSYLYGIITDYEYNSLSFIQLSGTAIETNIATFGTIILNGLPGDVGSTGGISGPYVTTFNGLTGAVTGVTTGTANNFVALQSFSAGISAAGATFSNTVYLNSNTLYKPTLQYYNEPVSSPSISGNTLSLDLSLAQIFTVNLNSDIGTFTIQNTPTTANRSMGLTLILTADGTPRAITWGSLIKWPSAIPPTLTSTNNKKDILSFFTVDGGTSYFGNVAGQNY